MAEHLLTVATDYYAVGTLAFTLGSALILHNVVRNGLGFPLAVIGLVLAIYGGLLGTRILFVFHVAPNLLVHDPLLAITFWQGGLSWLGGPVAGSAVFLLFMAGLRRPGWSHLGSAAPGIALSHALARSACLIRGCCYGRATALPWSIYSAKADTSVHPTQAYSMGIELLVAVGLQIAWWKRPDSRKYLMPVYMLLLGLQRFVIEYFRGGPPGLAIIPGLRFNQVACAVLIAVSIAVLLTLSRRARPAPSVAIATGTAALLLALSPRVTGSTASTGGFDGTDTASARREADASVDSATLDDVVHAGRYLVATRTTFRDALLPWVQFREEQGFEVVVGAWAGEVGQRVLLDWIDRESAGDTKFLLLVGDAPADSESPRPWHIPALMRNSQAGAFATSFPSDAGFSDRDHDGVPDFAVGRIPATTVDELERYLDKILRYESQVPMPGWERAVVWTGARGMDQEIARLTDELLPRVPGWLAIDRIRASGSNHSNSPPPAQFLGAIQLPAMISFIAAHGALDRIWAGRGGSGLTVLSTEDVQRYLTGGEPSGPLFILACDTGRYNSNEIEGRSLAETFLFEPGGPVAVVASSGTIHPMTNYLYTRLMLEGLQNLAETVGEFHQGVHRQIGRLRNTSFSELTRGDDLAASFDSFEGTMANHLPGKFHRESQSYNLLGDPALSFRHDLFRESKTAPFSGRDSRAR